MDMSDTKYKVNMQVPGFINIWVMDTTGNEKEWTLNVKYIENIVHINGDINECSITIYYSGSKSIIFSFDKDSVDKSSEARSIAKEMHDKIKSCMVKAYIYTIH